MPWYSENIGPLPAGAWIAVVGGGLALAYYEKKKSAANAAANAAAANSGSLLGSDVTGLPLGTPASTLPSGTTTTGTTPTFTDDTSWSNYVIQQLVSRGYDPILVSQTVGDYLAGNQLSAAETAMFATILTLIGPPPFPVALKPGPPIPPTQTPPPTTGTGSPATPASVGLFSPVLLYASSNGSPQTPADRVGYWDGTTIHDPLTLQQINDLHNFGIQIVYVTDAEYAAMLAVVGSVAGLPS